MATHYAAYGTTNLPARGAGLNRTAMPVQPQKLITWDLGTLMIGSLIGLVIGAFIFTPAGRDIGSAAGYKVSRRLREGKKKKYSY